METEICPISPDAAFIKHIAALKSLRNMPDDDWIQLYGSSTLRRAIRLNASWKELYRHERIAFDFGFYFESLPRSRVLFGDAFSEGDCSSITEAQWLAEKYILNHFNPDDHFEYKYIRVSSPNDLSFIEREGLGLILRKTSAHFVGKGNLVFSFIVQYDAIKKEWKQLFNPC